MNKRIEVVLSRISTEHTNFTPPYLLQKQANPPECERYRKHLTVKHVIVECRKVSAIYKNYNPALSDRLAGNCSVTKAIDVCKNMTWH